MRILDPSHDRFHAVDLPGAYEWTYVDGLSDDGELGFTAIWFRGVPMSPRYSAAIERNLPEAHPSLYTAFAFGLYRRSGRIGASLVEGPAALFDGSVTSADVRFKENRLFGQTHPDGTTTFRMTVDQALPLSLKRLVGEIDLRFPATSIGSLAEEIDSEREKHYWVPSGVGGRFSAAVDLVGPGGRPHRFRFEGNAYHDRNFGYEPLQMMDVDWYWGRLHVAERTFVFFSIQPRNGSAASPFNRVFLFEGGDLLRSTDALHLEAETKGHWATLSYPFRIGINDASGLTATATTRSLVESGPFYHRAVSQIAFDWEGSRGEGEGVIEYLRPSRLRVGIFRPFVKFRAKRVTK